MRVSGARARVRADRMSCAFFHAACCVKLSTFELQFWMTRQQVNHSYLKTPQNVTCVASISESRAALGVQDSRRAP